MLPSFTSGQSFKIFCRVLYKVACTLALSSSAKTSRISVRTFVCMEGKSSVLAIAGKFSTDNGRLGGKLTSYWAVTEVEKIRSATSDYVSQIDSTVCGIANLVE